MGARQRDAAVKELAHRFDEAQAAGELPGVNTVGLARWIIAVCQGISIQARSGASREDLHEVADLALAGWPDRSHIRPKAAALAGYSQRLR